MSKRTFLFCLYAGLICFWGCLEALDSFQQQQVVQNREAEIRTLLPLLRFRVSPPMLGRERLYVAAHSISEISRATASATVDRLFRDLGPRLHVLLENRNGEVLFSQGFSEELKGLLTAFIRSRQQREEGIPIPNIPGTDLRQLAAAMTGTNNFSPFWNRYEVARILLRGVPGMLLSGTYTNTPHESVEQYNRFAQLASFTPPIAAKNTGGLALFLPFSELESPDWFKTQASRRPPGCSLDFWAGTPQELAAASPFPAALVAEIEQQFRNSSQCTISRDGFTLGGVYSQRPIPFFQITYSRHAAHARTARTVPVFFLGITGILFLLWSGFLYDRPHVLWNATVTGKWFFFSILAILLPLWGTSWMLISMDNLARDWLINREYKFMEAEIAAHEEKMQEEVSKIVAEMRLMQDSFPWHNACPSDPFLEGIQARLDALGLTRLLYVDRWGNFFTFRDAIVDLRTNTSNHGLIARSPPKFSVLDQIIVWLLSVLERNLRFPPSQANEADELKFGLILEKLKESPESFLAIHHLLMSPGILTEMRWMRSETTWGYGSILRDRLHQAYGIFFAVFKRNLLQEKFLFRSLWNRRNYSDFATRCGFAVMNNHLVSSIVPESLAQHPVIQAATLRIALEGGIQQAELSLNGKSHLMLCRAFHNIDAIAIIAHPHPTSGLERISGGRGTAVAFAGYLLLVTFLLRRVFQRAYLAPIEEIRRGVVRMAAGNYEQALTESRRNELGTLAERFNRMAAGLKEKEYFSRFLSDLTRSAVKASGNLPSTRLEAAVLFSDVRGFTTMSETLPPEQIVELLNRHFTRMEACIEAEGGTIDKFIGDAIMAVFLPVHGREHPSQRAVAAGWRMLQAIRRETEAASSSVHSPENGSSAPSPEFATLPEIRCGVGIATGEVLMGVLGRKDGRQDFTVTGRTVNQAALMEKITKQAQHLPLVVCEHTLRQASGFAGVPLDAGSGRVLGYEITLPSAEGGRE